MNRSILIGVVAFVLSGAGSTAAVVSRARAAANEEAIRIAADSAAAAKDSLHADAKDSVENDTAHSHADTATTRNDSSGVDDHTKAAQAPVAQTQHAPPTPAAAVSAKTGLAADGRLAKLFGAMPVRDAAKVLDQMSDADIVSILSGMSDKRAGEILAQLPPARSAAITRLVLGTTKDPS